MALKLRQIINPEKIFYLIKKINYFEDHIKWIILCLKNKSVCISDKEIHDVEKEVVFEQTL